MQAKEKEGPITKLEDTKDIPGIGEKIQEKIKEIIETGALHQVTEIDPSYAAINTLMQVHGIGPAKASELVRTHGIMTIQDLEVHQHHLLNDVQKKGLKYYHDTQKRIPHAEMVKHSLFIHETIKSIDPAFKVTLAGSFRRQEKDSGDIDVLITHPNPPPNAMKTISDAFVKANYIKDILALGDKKCLAVCKLKPHRTFRRIDLMITPKAEFAFAELYFTGSQQFNIVMRNQALALGLSLSEHGLKDIKTGELYNKHFETEEDVFNQLGMPYVAPQDRTRGYK